MWQRIICERASAPKAEDGAGALDKPRARGPSVPASFVPKPPERIGAVAARQRSSSARTINAGAIIPSRIISTMNIRSFTAASTGLET